MESDKDEGGTDSVLKYTSNNNDPADLNAPEETKMLHKRRSHACTIFNSELHEGRPVVIVAGAWSGSGSKTAEILDYTNEGTWQESNLIFTSVLSIFL